ncbi:MAG TPA: hypothetical protein PKV72_03725 [Candidatus Peribacteria bacterium]|nr:hypothetical protein [Candidatus Peribacteria bacterium]
MPTEAPPPVQELGHADHNAHLLAAWKRESPYPYYWTRSALTETPYAVDDFVRDTWQRLTAVLQKRPALKGHRWDFERAAQYYLAYETVERSVRGTLHRQAPLEDTARALRSDLVGRVNAGSLLTATPISKLWGKGQQVFSDDRQHEFWVDRQIATSRYDKDLFLAAAGGNLQSESDTKAMQELLLEAVPQLCTLNTGDGKIIVLESAMRQKLWALVAGKSAFSQETRQAVVSAVMDSWSEKGDGDMGLMSGLEERLTRELFLTDRNAHWAEADKKTIGEEMKKKHNTHPFGTREERLEKLLALEWADTAGTPRTAVRLIDGTPQEAVQHSMGPLLKLNSLEPGQKALLRERLSVLQWHIMLAAQRYSDNALPQDERQSAGRDLQYLQGVLKKVGELMPLPWDEYPQIAYASLALYSQGEDATPRGLQGML